MPSRCVIIGASFGGLAAALTIKRLNPSVDVTVVDREKAPSPKTTGGVAKWWFEDLDIPIPDSVVATKLYGVRMISPSGVEALFKFRDSVAVVIDPERWTEFFIKWCRQLGVNFKLGYNASQFFENENGRWDIVLDPSNSPLSEFLVETDVIIAADGVNSYLRNYLGKGNLDPMDVHLGYEHTIDACPDWDPKVVHLIFDGKIAPKGYCWLFPEGEDRARVGLGVPSGLGLNPKHQFERLCERYPEFKQPAHSILGGKISTAPLPRSNVYKNILFVGDAGRFCSPLHGGGIGFAAKSGVYAGQVIAKGLPLKEYDRLWKNGLKPLLKRHYRLKRVLYSLSDMEFDDVIRTMREYRVKSVNPNKEFIRFVRYLLRKRPMLLPKFLKAGWV